MIDAFLKDQSPENIPPGNTQPFSDEEAAALKEIIRSMLRFSGEVGAQSTPNQFQAVPEPELRVRPPL